MSTPFFRESDPLRTSGNPSRCAQALHRLEGFLLPIFSRFLAICFARHQVDQKNFDTLRHDSVQTTEQARGTLLPPSTLRLVYLLYKLPNRPKRLSPSGIFRLVAQATKQAKRTFTLWHFYGLLDCKTPNRSDGLLPFDTWRLYHSQSAWVESWPRSQMAFDLHTWFDLQTS